MGLTHDCYLYRFRAPNGNPIDVAHVVSSPHDPNIEEQWVKRYMRENPLCAELVETTIIRLCVDADAPPVPPGYESVSDATIRRNEPLFQFVPDHEIGEANKKQNQL